MSDGRAFTNFLPNCQINQDLQRIYGTTGLNEYRHYLQTNAEKVMRDTMIKAGECASCPICKASLEYKPKGFIPLQQ
jgi:hypothetical protein